MLTKFIKDINIKHIYFYDDIVNKKFTLNLINKNNYKLFTDKCDSLNIKYHIGNYNINEKYIDSELIIPELKLNNSDIIHTNIKNDFYKYIEYENNLSYKWFNLQKIIANVLVKKYTDETFKKEYNNKNKIDIINKIYNKYFKSYNNNNIIKIILEELPLNTSEPINNIIKWINNIILNYKYDFMSSIIKENKNELLFSQNAFYIKGKYEIPYLLLNYHMYMPNSNNLITDYNEKDLTISNNKINNIKLPSIFNGSYELMKTKWLSRKKAKWHNMVIIKSNYNLSVFIEFVDWLSKYLKIYITYDEIRDIVNNYYIKLIFDKNSNNILFEDPSFFNSWLDILNIKSKITIKKFNQNYYNKYNKDKIKNILDEVIKKKNLYPNDITLKVISDIFNISILLIHRTKYGTTKETDKRNDLDDLRLSSTFIQCTKNMYERPLFIFNKEIEENYIVYNPIIEKTDKTDVNSIYIKYKDIPDNIKSLIELHIEYNKKK